MKTKANTLIEEGQDIKVKSVETDEIVFEYDFIFIKEDDSDNIQIENKVEGIFLVDGYNHKFTINDEGYVFRRQYDDLLVIDNDRASFYLPVQLPAYTTALRPSVISEGSVIYDSTLKKCILYNGTAWVNLDGTALA